MEVILKNYQKRIYENYASVFKGGLNIFDSVAAHQWGKSYDHYFRGWLPAKKDAAILDLACGGGNLLFFFQQRGFTKIHGVDISSEQVRLARQVTPEVTEANVLDFLEAHLQAFDLLTGLDIIEHFPKDDVLRFLDLCHAALRPGGRLILQTPNADTPWGITSLYGDFTHEICFTPHALGRLLALCGFKELEVRETGPAPWNYSLMSTGRYVLGQGMRALLKLWNMAETGTTGSGVFTRVCLVSGIK